MTETQIKVMRLLNNGLTVEEITTLTGVTRNTIEWWQGEEYFKRARYMDMTLKTSRHAPRAIDVLVEVMNDTTCKGSDRVKAATEILNRSGFVPQQEIKFSVESTKKNALLEMDTEDLKGLLSMISVKKAEIKDVTPKPIEIESTSTEVTDDDAE